jgi:hypothetical protein
MKHSLLLVAVVALVAFAAPAHSQYMFLDTNNDGICNDSDVLSPASDSIDVWLSTNTDAAGNPVTCNSSTKELTINSYEFFVHSTGTVTFGAWADNMGFTSSFGDFQGGADAYHGRGSGTALAAGTYLLGTLAISGVSSGATVSIIGASTVNDAGFTSFGSQCEGNDFDNTYKFPTDWTGLCGTASPIPVTPTTWGQIKNIYR